MSGLLRVLLNLLSQY